MKTLEEYYQEVTLEDNVIVESPNAATRKSIYRVKREAENKGILKEFVYNAKTKDSPASAIFTTENKILLDTLLETEELK